jgi:hypothetical protein
MTPIDAATDLLTHGKITQNEFLRIAAMRSQELQIAAVSAVTEREFMNAIRELRSDMVDLKLRVARRKIMREVNNEVGSIFRVLLGNM